MKKLNWGTRMELFNSLAYSQLVKCPLQGAMLNGEQDRIKISKKDLHSPYDIID